MRIGILKTGAPPAQLEERFGGYDAMFPALLGDDYEWRSYDAAAGELPEQPEDEDAYIVTGSPAGVYEDHEWIGELKEFLRRAKGKAKLIGVCFGHQIMAEAFGGKVEKSHKGWGVGLQTYKICESAPWMDDAGEVSIPVSHQDQIVRQPPESRILAASGFTPFGVLEYRDQPAISFQFHPEFEPEFAKALIESRRERLPDPDAALASLDGPDDRARVAQWMRRFLEQPL